MLDVLSLGDPSTKVKIAALNRIAQLFWRGGGGVGVQYSEARPMFFRSEVSLPILNHRTVWVGGLANSRLAGLAQSASSVGRTDLQNLTLQTFLQNPPPNPKNANMSSPSSPASKYGHVHPKPETQTARAIDIAGGSLCSVGSGCLNILKFTDTEIPNAADFW